MSIMDGKTSISNAEELEDQPVVYNALGYPEQQRLSVRVRTAVSPLRNALVQSMWLSL